MEKTIQRFHCTTVKMEISILYHVIVNSQLNRDNLTRCYIEANIHCEMDFYSVVSSRPFTHCQISWNIKQYYDCSA